MEFTATVTPPLHSPGLGPWKYHCDKQVLNLSLNVLAFPVLESIWYPSTLLTSCGLFKRPHDVIPACSLLDMNGRKAPSYAAAESTQINTYKMVSVPTSFNNWEDVNQAQNIFSV